MPVSAYGNFASDMSNFDDITQRKKNSASTLRNMASNKKAIDATNSLAKQYDKAVAQLAMGKSKFIKGQGSNLDLSGINFGGGGSNLSGNAKMDRFLRAIRQQESGGRYGISNSIGATGAYQVMTANIAPWTKAALGRSVSRSTFLKSPKIQDQVARHILGGYVKKYGYGGAAAAWYGGPRAGSRYASGVRNTRNQRGGPSIAKYVQQVLARM